MITLDEVIKNFEICRKARLNLIGCDGCTYAIGDNDFCIDCNEIDVLEWLKGYRAHIELDKLRDKYSDTSQITCPKCHSEFVILDDPDGDHAQLLKCQALLQDFYRNDPLTWDELKQMEGKPVWIEGEHGCIWNQKAWSLIRLDAENDDIVICFSTDNGAHYEFVIDKIDYGTDWQAYRKERTN